MNDKADLQQNLDHVSQAVARFSAVSAGIAALREKYEKVIFPVDTADGLKDAKEARLAIRQPRYEVERIRKEAKAPILAIGRQLDAKAKEITEALMALEEPIDTAIKHEEGRKERERLAKIAAEQKRVEDIQERIAEIRGAVQAVTSVTGLPSSAKVADFIGDVERIAVDDSFMEFRPQAEDAKTATLATLRQMHAAAVEREAEQERIKAERAELERLRAEQAKREAEERQRLEAEAAKERARIEAEQAKERAAREEQARKEREALEAQRKQQEAERKAIEAENRRLAEERAALERAQAEERRKAEAAERKRLAEEAAERKRKEEAEKAARKAKFPGEQAIVDALCEHFGVPVEVVMKWLGELRRAA